MVGRTGDASPAVVTPLRGSMLDIQSAAAEIRRGKKEDRKKKKKPHDENIMVCRIPQGGHNSLRETATSSC